MPCAVCGWTVSWVWYEENSYSYCVLRITYLVGVFFYAQFLWHFAHRFQPVLTCEPRCFDFFFCDTVGNERGAVLGRLCCKARQRCTRKPCDRSGSSFGCNDICSNFIWCPNFCIVLVNHCGVNFLVGVVKIYWSLICSLKFTTRNWLCPWRRWSWFTKGFQHNDCRSLSHAVIVGLADGVKLAFELKKAMIYFFFEIDDGVDVSKIIIMVQMKQTATAMWKSRSRWLRAFGLHAIVPDNFSPGCRRSD